jgi:hypothetical protein
MRLQKHPLDIGRGMIKAKMSMTNAKKQHLSKPNEKDNGETGHIFTLAGRQK